LGETLSDPAHRFLDRLCGEIDDADRPLPEPFTAADLRRRLNAGRSTVAGFLSELADKGFLEQAETAGGGRGRPARSWRLVSRDFDVVHILPPPSKFF
jgi:response regulator of citrate/malate metabolism